MLMNNPFEKLERNSKPLLLDGAIGSYLQQKGFETNDILWTTEINQTNPDEIIKVHREYIDAGADIITTNTFRTNPTALLYKKSVRDLKFYVSEAVMLTKEASSNKNVLVAGSNAPAEDCYQRQRTLSYSKLELNHMKHIELLVDSGIDFVLNETQSHLDEIKIICDYCDKNKIPYLLSIYLDEKLKLLSGETLDETLALLNDSNVLAVGFNCISPDLYYRLIGSTKLPEKWGFYLNCGKGKQTDKIIECGIQPEEYLEVVKKSIQYFPSFIGSCCGSSPAHTKKMREFLDEKSSS
jgi:homocysteine S-methyltransferase